jgi:hypothetical protein
MPATASYTRTQPTNRTASDHYDDALNAWMDQEVDRRGWRQYMYDRNFNWMADLRRRARSAGFNGHNLDEVAAQTFEELTFSGGEEVRSTDGITSFPGSIWRFNPDRGEPLDGFWKKAADRRIKSQIRNRRDQRKRMPTVNITPRKEEGDTGPGISEGSIGDKGGESPSYSAEMEEILGDFREYLSKQRNSDRLLLVYDAILTTVEDGRHRLMQKDIAEITGLSSGQVSYYLGMIQDAMARFTFGNKELTQLYKLFRLPTVEEAAEKPKPAPKKGPATGTYLGPDGNDSVPVTVIRKGVNSITVRATDPAFRFENGENRINVPINQVAID